MPKRYRTRHAKPGQLMAYYGRAEGDGPDVCYAWGQGCEKADSRLLHSALTMERPRFDFEKGHDVFGPSFLEELEARGYDVTTLKFSIQKREAAPSRAE